VKYIFGLGNPGIEYKNTKHSIGFEVVQAIAKESGIKINKESHFSIFGKGKVAGEDVTLVLPQTYMNLSGNAAGELLGKDVKAIGDMLVICDDINLDIGRIRLRKHGSAGGHKGLESIIHTLKTNEFARLRVGIATEIHKGDISNYVLSPFKRHEMRNVAHTVSLARDAAISMIEEGMDSAMSKFNKCKGPAS